MCGIAGYIGKRSLDPERAERGLRLMAHRGPDARGVYWHAFGDHHVCLLHTRLAIIDLDRRADQPFRFGSRVMVYNGELYNFPEVKASLSAAGRSFSTQSDTEVLIQCLDAFGWQGLDSCEGMWALAAYDEGDGSLLLARDRFGEKPLYLYEDDTGFYFGSEIKFLAALAGRRLEVNYRHIHRFLVNGYKSLYKVPETFFERVEELPPAHVLSLSPEGSRRKWEYWDRAGCRAEVPMSYEEAVAGAREALIEAVRLRLRADVPLSFCMSGGVDSNAVISIARRVFDYDVHGFTIVNSDERYDEQDLVAGVVAELGIRHSEIPVNTSNFLPNLRNLVLHHDAPVYTISYYAHWLLMQSIAREGYRISVSGTAADELFSGYYDHHNMYLYEVREDRELFDASLANWKRHIGPIVRNPVLRDPLAFVKDPEERRHIYLDAPRFASYLTEDFREEFREIRYREGLLRNRMLNELFEEAVPVILHEDDLNAMCFSIENRSPFLDRRLFEFCYSIPTRYLIGDGYNKKVLRDAMRGIVPNCVLDTRRKVGFNAPIFSFLDRKDPEVRSVVLDGGPVFEHVRRDRVEALMNADRLPNSDSKFLFYFLGVKFFLEAFSS